MFSSKFLSGANPLNAVSSAVNKFGLFGDDGEGDKNQKSPSQQGVKPTGEQQPGAGPGKGGPQHQQGPQKSGQDPPMQKPLPKQGPPQQHGNGQTGPPNKPSGQPVASQAGTQPEGQLKGEPTKNQPKGPPHQGSPKPGVQQHTGAKPESPKAPSQQQVPPKTGMQQQGPAKTGMQDTTKVGSQKPGSQQGSPNLGQKQQGSQKLSQQQQGPPTVTQQKQGSPRVGQQQQGFRTTPQQQSSNRPLPQQQVSKGPGTPGLSQAGSSSPGATKAGPQSKAVSKSLCPVCNTTELNMHTKEPPNHKSCTQCKTEVCSLCGFSPPDSDGREWLCLTCQIQRAQGTSEPPGPSMKKPTPNKMSAAQNQTSSPAAPVKKEMSAPGSPQRMQSTSAKVPAKGEAAKGPEIHRQASPASAQKMTPEAQRASGPQKPDQTSQTGRKQSGTTPLPQQESGGLFGFGGAKTEAAKPEESVTGKMFGFGSSIFSSASTLIASAVQDEPKTTPPVSPKMQSAKETKPPVLQKSVQDKKHEQPQQAQGHPSGQAKSDKAPSETPKAAAASHNVPKPSKSTCPLCKMVLNMGSKDPPNYNTCTDCKSTVCNQCGFNPMPNVLEGKEWLCLNCQVKRAAGGIEPQTDNSSFKKTTPAQPALQKTSAPGSPQRKVSTPAAQPAKTEAAKGPGSYQQTSPAPGQKAPQESQKTGPQKQPDQTSQTAQKQGSVPAAAQQESTGFFGFGGSKSQTVTEKPAESVTGKMFGFGSSIFSSASTLINSAVQDEPKPTPPVSPKIPASKDSKSSTAKKPEQEKKSEQPHQAKGSPTVPKVDKDLSASPIVSKAGQSTCPLCKLELNVGSKDPPNYNTCTECKNTICNQCGFNPMPNVKEVKEWLCLNCQMQRALGASEPPGTPLMKLQASPNKVPAFASVLKKETPLLEKHQKTHIPTPAESKIKDTSTPGSPQTKPSTPPVQPAKAEVMKGPESQNQVSPAPGQGQKAGPQKPPNQTSQIGPKQSNTTSTTQKESSRFFGSGDSKPQPDTTNPSESLGGKMFGFGSSIFSSASTLINSAVQDDSKTTPPVSPQMPAAKATKSPLAQKQEQEKKLEQVKLPKSSPLLQDKVEKTPSGPPKDATASTVVPKAGQSTCPLCKVELNFGSNELPNYNKCTKCKSTVCNQCGFNPLPNVSEVKEWLCLNCQMQRALNVSELTGSPTKPHNAADKISPSAAHEKITPNQVETAKKELSKSDAPLKMETPLSGTLQRKGSSTPGSPQKTHPTAALQASKASKGPERDTQGSSTPGQKTQDISGASGSQKPTQQASQPGLKQSKVTPDKQQESGKLFGLSGPKTGPDTSKTTESVTGKMFGFGSSIFSSASTLISSAVQEESRTTPPGSRKMSAPAHVSPKMSAAPKISPKSTPTVSPKMSPAREPKTQKQEREMKPEESHQSKENKSQPPKTATMPQMSPSAGQSTCPLCKVTLNIGSKDAPNYNTCTECKTTVCTQCGFNPMPIGEVKEWLCLSCQMKRAVGASESPGPGSIKSHTSPTKVHSPAAAQLKDSPKPTTPQMKDSAGSVEPVSPRRKQSTASLQSGKPETATTPVKQTSPAPDRKIPQEIQKTGPKKPPDQASQPGRKQSNATAAIQQESGSFFGFGGAKSQPDATKPAESVTGKMFGFGSSIFSSASTLITSVQDQPKTTPAVSPKMSPAKELKSPGAHTLEKTESSKQTKTPPSGQAKLDKSPSEPPKAVAAQAAIKPSQSTCPLCKVKLNMGSKDPPNYNACTECKNTVCNQCGFNPMPNETAVKEWLCLTCQMQRALGVTQQPGEVSANSQITAKPQKKDIISHAEPEKKEALAPHSPQRKPYETTESVTADANDKLEGQKQTSPAESQKRPQETQKTSGPNKTPDQTSQIERKQSNASAMQQESGSFFGFGGGKTKPADAKPPESGTGKMFGFGSSIFSSASTLISSAVQDKPKTTPPVSPKMSPAKEIKSRAAQSTEQQKQPEQPQQTNTPPLVHAKVEKAPSESPNVAAASKATVKPVQCTCPLCNVILNMGSNDVPNYNTCTECKNTVCNQCGFNPMPNVSEVKKWLCLTCQMQSTLTAAESVEPPPMKPQVSPKKASTSVAAKNDATASQKKDIISTQNVEVPDKNQRDSPTPGVPLPAKETPGTISGTETDEKTGSPSTKEAPTCTAPPTKETTTVSKLNKPLPTQTPPVNTDIGTSLNTEKDITPSISPATEEVSETIEEKAEIIQKSSDQPVKSSNEARPGQTLNKESNLVEPSVAKSASPAVNPTSQESGIFPSFGSPKSQHAASKTTEAVTGKMLGFGSSLFSSASSLITSAVREESRTTPPSSRKMSAPAQVSDKMSALQVSPKSSPPVSPRITSAKEDKEFAAQKPHLEKILDQPQHTKAPLSESAKQSICLLCKAELNMDSKDPPNYNTCTECKTTVCNKCGFSPLPNLTEVKEWLCLNCQMQRALGASEPPGLPMIKPQPSPSKEVPATTQKKEVLMSVSQEDIPKPATLKNELFNVATTKETESSVLGEPTEKVSPIADSLPDKTVSSTMTKANASQKPSLETPRQPDPLQQQPPKTVTSTTKSTLPPDQEAEKPLPQQPPKTVTSIAPPPDQQAEKPLPQQPPKTVTSIAKSAPPPDQQAEKPLPQQPPKTVTSIAKSAPPPDQQAEKPLPQQPPKTVTSIAKSAPPPDQQAEKPLPQQPPKTVTSIAKSAPPPDQQAEKSLPQQPPKTVTSIAKSAPQPDQEAGKPLPHQPQKAVTSATKSAPPQDREVGKPSPQQSPKAGVTPQAKSVPPPAVKQESGGFFGFGGPKTQPSAAKSESVTGKMFGFGSSFLSSASTLITSAVQDEPKSTPPPPRKMSTTAHVSPKTTPPASPKTLPAKDTKPPTVQKTEDKKPDKPQQEKTQSAVQTKVDNTPSEPRKVPTDIQGVPKADQSICPLCKVDLSMGSKDPPNFNTCTECKNTVCNQCGFNPVPNMAEVKEWLCLNCQMQRALRMSEPTGHPVVKPQPSPNKVFTPSSSEQKVVPTLVQKENSKEPTDVKKEVTQAIPDKKETPKDGTPEPTDFQRMDTPRRGSTQKTPGQDVAGQKELVEKPPQPPQFSQTTKSEVKTDLSKEETEKQPRQPLKSVIPPAKSAPPAAPPAKQESGKPPQQPSKSVMPPAKSAPPPAQPPKQESGGFFGFGGPKTQPTAAKATESVSGKMFGFGSSIFNSASTLITSAVQEGPKTTPPTPRKMSTSAHVSPKTTPPVSPKMSPAKEAKLPAAHKSEPSPQTKPAPSAQAKEEKVQAEPPKMTEVTQVPQAADLSTCPLCKAELNVGSKDPPNYNTCTNCKNTVCSLCGFNPMPHTAAKEWLCLNCQTQRALLGQLGDPGKMPQPSPVSAKPENQATPATKKAEPKIAPPKTEPTSTVTKSHPTPAPIEAVPTVPTPEAKREPITAVKMDTTAIAPSAQIELETTLIPTRAKVAAEKQPVAASTAGPIIPTVAPVQQTEVTPKAEVPQTDFPKIVPLENKDEAVKIEFGRTEFPKPEEFQPDISEVRVEAGAAAPSSLPLTESTIVPASSTAAKEATAEVVPRPETKPELPLPESVIKEAQPGDHIELAEPSKSLQQVEVPQSQEPQGLLGPIKAVDSKEVDDKLTEKIPDVTSIIETQPASTKTIIIKEQDETKNEQIKQRKVSLPSEQTKLENIAVHVTSPKPESKAEEHDEDQPHILPISQELKDGLVVSDTGDSINTDPSMPVKEEVKAGRRRLSFQVMDESSGSELTPSPSPKVQRRRLRVSNVSSSSEDIKTESADSSMEDEEFIRKQIMGMGDDNEMSVSEDEEVKNLANEETIKEVELDNASMAAKSLSGNTDNEDSPARKKAFPKTDIAASQDVPETMPRTTFKKAIPIVRQRQSTDEEVESITESLSKGSSSVQASSFTPGSSPTSASSLEEDSDSSPSHKKVSGDKQHRKGKHRQPTKALPTIEDSSEEEKMREEEKSRKDKDELRAQDQPLSLTEGASSTEDLREVTIMDETNRTSGSEYSASIESESEARRAVQRGRKPSPTVIPYTSSDPIIEKDTLTKSLKSAEEAYEEIIQKTKAIPGESPPDIEPLYGGMAIEDYLYESLVEEPEIKIGEYQEEKPTQDASSEPLKKLRSPEEVYEEMMQKKRELMMIEEEFQQAQTAMESSSTGTSVTEPLSVGETCVVTIPTEETSFTEQTDMSLIGTENSTEMPPKKKKRPAPPRPSEPPKRSDVTSVPSTPSGSIGFVRPMVPMDPALRKALFPIPDLKITQCSSGEEEDDSLADEYGVGISSDITPSDDSGTKDDPSISPPLSETAEMEPICVVCEMPEPKPIPTPISAPELTTTPSPISPLSPPTSPASPDSSLASNATSSSLFQAQTPLSSDSTPLSTPTPPASIVSQSSPEISPLLPSTTAVVSSNGGKVSGPTPNTVIVAIPDVVSDPSKAQTTTVVQVEASTSEAPTSSQVAMSTPVPVVVQMPDLVSSPSQVPVEPPAVIQVSAPSPAPVVVSAQPTALAAATSVAVSTLAAVHVDSAPVTLASCTGPVIVQMPDLVSTTSPISAQTPLPGLAVVTTPAQTQAKVVPVQPAIPSMSPVVVSTHVPAPAPASTTIVKKKVPPPPPPRSTSVSLPEPNIDLPLVRTVQQISPAVTTTIAMGTTVASQPMQSVAVDIQPRMEDIQPDSVAVPQVVTPTRQGHVVIIVPSVENISLLGKTPQDIGSTESILSTASLSQSTQITTYPASDIPSTETTSLSTKVPAEPVASIPPLPPQLIAETKVVDTVEIPVADTPPPPPTTLPKPAVYPKPTVSTVVTTAMATVAKASVTTTGPNQTVKPPPPIPPKPISIPAGLVFSHKPGESVKPPPPPVAPKAATLPRTKEPPNALSLSLTRPVESKLGATSPKSPLSPRHAKCLQTYVVITLPSEPGSPTEGITVQAPVRRGSIPSTKVSGVRTTPLEQKTPTEAFSAQATVRRASVPTVRHPPPTPVVPVVAAEQVTACEVGAAKVHAREESMSSVEKPPPFVADVIAVSPGQETCIQAYSVPPPIKKPYVQQQQSITQPLPPSETMFEVITMPPEPKVLIQPLTIQATASRVQSLPPVAQHPNTVKEVKTVPTDVSAEALVPQAQILTVPVQRQPSSENVADVSLGTVVAQDIPAAVSSTVLYPQMATQVEIPQKEQKRPTEVRPPPIPGVSQQILVQEELAVAKAVIHSTEQEMPFGFDNTHTIAQFSSVPQTVQPLEVLPLVTDQLPTQHPVIVGEAMTLPTKSELPTEVVTTDPAVRIPDVTTLSQVTHPLSVVAEAIPTSEEVKLMPLSTVGQMITPIVGEATPSPLGMKVQQIALQPEVPHVTYIPQVYGAITPPIMSHSTQEVAALQPEHETTLVSIEKDPDIRRASIASLGMQPQVMAEMPGGVIASQETTSRRRTSISSIVQPSYTTSEIFTYPAEYETPTQVVTTEAFAATRRESITMQQPLPLAQVVNIPAEKDVPIDGYTARVPYRIESVHSTEQRPQVLSYSSEYDHPLEIITTEAYTRRPSVPTAQDIPQGVSVAPVTITKIQQESIESQEIRGPEKVVSSMSHMYSSSISTSGQPPESLPSLVTQVVTTEVQRTTVSVVHERLPQVPPPSVAISIQPDTAKVQPLPKQNGKIIYPGDVIDLRTMKVGVKMTEQGMDLTPPDSCRQSFSSDSSGRQITAVQPEIVNLSAEITPATTLSVVTDSITIVTCTATIASYNNTPAEKPLDLQGPVRSLPLPLTTYKPFEPLAQIVYKPVNSQAVVSAVASTAQDIPMNLSFGALISSGDKQPIASTPIAISNGGPVLSLEPTGAMDLSNYRPMRAMVALSGTSPGVVTTVVEDDGTPVDLTAGRRNVCCDVIYKLPFTGSCRTPPPVTTQPDNRFGHRDDHCQYNNAGLYGIKGMNGIKASMSETNLTDAGLFSYDPKTDYGYLSGSSDGAIDLTAAKLSAGKALDYTSKATGGYPGMTTTPYSQVPAAGFGVNSVLRTADGIVYSSVAAPVPSTYAITTQPGSIFSTTLTPTSTVQNQSLPHPYGFIPSTDTGQIIPFDTGLPKELLPTALADIITGYPDMYSDTTLDAIAASLDALASSPIFPGLDNTKMAQYQMEREFLELEKLKQLCLAEELEWERQEIQRYREQEQLMVQRELEELQALKQQLLLQQEEEHHAHMVAQQETYAQQKEQLQQIQQLQLQLQRQLDEHYGTTGTTGNLLDAKYAGVGDSGQYWPVKDEGTTSFIGTQLEESQDQLNLVKKLQADQDTGKKIIDSGVQTDDEDSAEKQHVGRRKKSKRNVDSSAQTDDEDQDEWDAPTKARRRSRKHSSDGKHGSKVSSIAIQTVAEISVQTDHSGTIKRPNVQMDTKVEIIKHISAPENSQRGGSLSCQTDSDRRHTPIEVGYSTLLTTDVPSKSKVFHTPVSPLSPEKSLGGQRMLTADPTRFSSGPRILKSGQKSLSDPKSLSPSTEDRMGGYYADSYSSRGSPSGTGKKVKRTLPDPPPEDDSLTGRSSYSTNSARRRLARSTTMARAKILQDIDKELDLVERESSKLRKKQAELDEEEKEIDAKLRYLEMGINRRKEALLKEREKRERAYLQGVAEERDYMSDSEVSNIREARGDGLERPRTAPQSEFDQFIPPQTEADSQYNTLTSPYSHYAQYAPQTQTTSHYTQQNLYQQQSLYHQQVSPYPTLSLSHAQSQPSSYQHALLLQQGKQRQTNLTDLEPKITTNYEVIRNQPLLIVPTSTESGYGVAHLGGKYGNLDLRLGLEERSMASSPMSSISADSFYADIDHHNARNYVLIEDIGELTKASVGLSNTGLGTGFNLPDKELSKADRLLRAAEVRRTAEVADFLGSSRLQGYGKGEDDTMEEPYELKLLKQQIKQEFRRGTEGLEHLTGLGLPQYLPSDSNFRHFPKGEKYSIGRLTLEKQAAKQLPAAVLYQKQMKNKKALIDPKAITKFSPIQESRDLEPDFGSYMGSGASSVTNLAATARLLQDEITFGLRKNLSEQQKYLGSSLGANLAGSLNLGQSLGLGSNIRATAQDDGTYPSGTRSRPSSRPSSVYGLDLSIKRDLSSSSLRLKTEGEVLDAAFAPGVARAKPTSLPISQSRGRIPIVAQNSEEESPLSPVGQPMGMARASAGPLPPISADSRDQFGSSHSLPEVQQHMREESRTRGYDRDIAFIMDDLQGAMSDSEAGGPNWNIEAYHLRREDTDWFDKPREGQPQSGNMLERRQIKLVPYAFPHTRIKLKRDLKDTSVSGNGLGIRVVGGKEIPGSRGEIGAYIAKVIPGGVAEQTGKVVEGMQVLEWNGVPLTGKTYEEVQCIMSQPCAEAELCVRLDLNMLSDPEHPQALEHHVQLKAGGQRSPGVDPKQLAAELQKVSQQQTPGMAGTGIGPGGLGVLSALERSALLHSGTGSAASSGVPSPGQPASPAINKKQRHKPTEVMKIPHPITGEIQLQINYDRNLGNLIVHVLQARNLAQRDNDGYSDPFVKVYLLPGRGADNKRRTKYAQKTMNPEWNQTVIYKNIHLEQLKKKTLEVTVWDYDRSSSNDFLGEVLIDLSNTAQLDNTPRWLPLKEQSESIEHNRAHHAAQGPPGSGSGQGHGQGLGHMSGPGMGSGHGMGQGQAPGQGDGSHESPKNSVIKSRSHGIFPDPAKDMQMLPLEKSHSSPGSSKSSSDGQLRSHGPSRSQSKSSVTQAHLEDAGIAIAAAEAAVQQSRLQPRPGHRLGDVSGSVVLSAPSLVGDAYGGLDGEEGAGTGVDSAIFQVPRIGKTIPNGTDKNQLGTPENEGGKTQVMGEIKVALKKEVKTEGDQLVLEILQCRNITYKFKSPDHLPDLYVKLYVVNVATQKRIIKKKTRVCRHDREPSFNETFRFPLNPTGHSIQLFLVSNGGKFMKKTLIGEAYIWLDKVDMRKRVVSWHKLFVSSTQTNP